MRRELLFETELSDARISVIADRDSYRLCDHMVKETEQDALMGIHAHSFYELFYFPEGGLTVVTENGVRCFEKKAVIIPPRFNHYIDGWPKDGYCFIFALEQNHKKEGSVYEKAQKTLSREISAFDIDGDMRFYMEKLADIVRTDDGTETAEHVVALLFMSFFKTLALSERKASVSNTKYRNYVNTLDIYISKHYSERIRIDDIAEELHLCSKQVSRIINKEYGMSLSRVVHKHRMSVACMLLRETSLTIGQIAESVGYEYENYFFRLFKETYGITPAEYREKAR